MKFDSKVFFQMLFRPTANFMARTGFTANQVTASTILFSLAAGTAVCSWPEQRWPLIMILLVMFVRLAFNHIDGMLAREHGMITPLGGILNELSDVISDIALFLPLLLFRESPLGRCSYGSVWCYNRNGWCCWLGNWCQPPGGWSYVEETSRGLFRYYYSRNYPG